MFSLKFFPNLMLPICIPTNTAVFKYFFTLYCQGCLFVLCAILHCTYAVVTHCDFDFHLHLDNVEQLFVCLLVIWTYSCKFLYRFFCLSFDRIVFIFLIDLYGFSIYSRKKPFVGYMNWRYLFLPYGLTFCHLSGIFGEQKFFLLINFTKNQSSFVVKCLLCPV